MDPPSIEVCGAPQLGSPGYGIARTLWWPVAGAGILAAVASLSALSAADLASQLHTATPLRLVQPKAIPMTSSIKDDPLYLPLLFPETAHDTAPLAAAHPAPEMTPAAVRPTSYVAFAVFFLIAGAVSALSPSASHRGPSKPLLPLLDGPFAGDAERPSRGPLQLFAQPAATLNPFSLLETIGGLFSSDQIDIQPVRPEQLRPGTEEYVLRDIASLLAREIFRLKEGSDICRKVTDEIENYNLRQFGIRSGYSEMFVATNRTTGEFAGCVFVNLFRMVGEREYEAVNAPELPRVDSLAVEPKYAGRGVGGQLLKRCEKTAREWGYKRVLLQVYSENTNAIRFYRKRGYREVCEDNTILHPVGSSLFGVRYKEFDHKVMVKQLSPFPF